MLHIGEVHWKVVVGAEPPLLYDAHITEEDIDMARDELEDLVGDGNAKVTCSMGIKDADYGNGFEAFCSVTLTCNQDRRSVRDAQKLGQDLLDGAMQQAFEAAHETYKELGPHPVATKRGK